MVQANELIELHELRIGNLLRYDGNYVHVTTISMDIDDEYQDTIGFCMMGENTEEIGDWNRALTDKLQPIALTPEILEKCGFERLPNFNIMSSMVKYLPRKRHLSFGCIGTPNEMLFIQEMEDDRNSKSIIVLHNYDYDGYMHLHQLQNLYFSLTGEELKVNLTESVLATNDTSQ